MWPLLPQYNFNICFAKIAASTVQCSSILGFLKKHNTYMHVVLDDYVFIHLNICRQSKDGLNKQYYQK